MKRRARHSAPRPVPLVHVCGSGSAFGWLVPTAPHFKNVDEVLGFEGDDGHSGGAGGHDEERGASGDEGGEGTPPTAPLL